MDSKEFTRIFDIVSIEIFRRQFNNDDQKIPYPITQIIRDTIKLTIDEMEKEK